MATSTEGQMSTHEYLSTRKQWLTTLQKLIASRDDSAQDELFREAELLFTHMTYQKREAE